MENQGETWSTVFKKFSRASFFSWFLSLSASP
jgi:hypothetical protein